MNRHVFGYHCLSILILSFLAVPAFAGEIEDITEIQQVLAIYHVADMNGDVQLMDEMFTDSSLIDFSALEAWKGQWNIPGLQSAGQCEAVTQENPAADTTARDCFVAMSMYHFNHQSLPHIQFTGSNTASATSGQITAGKF